MPPNPYDSAAADGPVLFPLRVIAVMLVIPVIAVALWVILPDGPLSVAMLAIAVLALIFGGVGGAMLRRNDLERRPRRRAAGDGS